MKTRILTTTAALGVFAALALFGPGTRGQTPEKKSTGYWALVDVTEYHTPDNKVLELYPAKITGKRGELHSAHSALEKPGGKVRWSQEARWQWSDPPGVLPEGDLLTLRLARETILDTAGSDRASNGAISADITRFEADPGTAAIARFYDRKNDYLLNLKEPAKMSVDFSGKVPGKVAGAARPGTPGEWISLRIGVSHGRDHVYYYNYRWTEGTPPAGGTSTPPTGGASTTPTGGAAGPGTGTSGTPGAKPGSGVSGEPASVTQMTLQAGKRRVPVGQTVTLPVWLLKAKSVANMNFNVAYDAAVARSTGAFAKGNLLDKTLFEVNLKEAGIVRVGFAGNANLSGDGTVVQLTFTAAGAVGSRTPIRLAVTTISSASGTKPTIATIDGEILVVGPDGEIPGDSDGDGQLTARDAGDALKMSVKLIPVKMVCDVDKDGQVTSTDARLILAKATGKP